MNLENDEEVLDFMTRLLERLHQAGFDQQGSHYQFVYVAPGAQHVETQIVASPCPPPKGVGSLKREEDTCNLFKGRRGTPSAESTLPEVLATEAAMALWEKVRAAGYVDANYQPLISRTQAALLADAMAERLSIREKWKVFETLWNRKYMRSDYNLALTQQQSLDFQDELKRVFV